MKKIDFKKELKHLYNPSKKEFSIIDVPEMNFLMIDGKGDPNTAREYTEAVEALYALSYAIKFMIKKGPQQIDYGVMPLEGLWWADDMAKFSVNRKDDWKWTAMIMQPEFVSADIIVEATAQVEKKKNPAALPKIRFAPFPEGKTAQIMYIGSYSDEGPTIKKMHGFIAKNSFELHGKHHEIYLGDPRRTAPEKLKTIIRQPIK